MTEEYKAIVDFENYEVSNLGNVKNKKTGKILKLINDGKDYHRVGLYKDNKKYNKRIHQLIAQAFIPNPDNEQLIDHIDNSTLNNSINNLRWVSTKENAQNAKLSTKNTSGSKEVTYDKLRNKWRAQIMIDGICINLGRYDNIEDAKAARVARANTAFGVYINSCEN